MIAAYINFNSLPCWLSLEGLRRIRERTGAEIRWEPMLGSLKNVTPEPKDGDPLAEYKLRRARARKQFSEAEHRRMCARLGISPEAGAREFHALAVSLGLLWLAEAAAGQDACLEYAESVFAAHFRDGARIDSLETAALLLDAADIATDGFERFAEDSSAALLDSRDSLLERGILFSPAFVLDGEVFHGRQHMPLITWMLEGRRGAPPV